MTTQLKPKFKLRPMSKTRRRLNLGEGQIRLGSLIHPLQVRQLRVVHRAVDVVLRAVLVGAPDPLNSGSSPRGQEP